jgi:transposase
MARITNSPQELRKEIGRAGKSPQVVLEATYGWYWAADTLAAAGAEVHLAHPLGVKAFTDCRRGRATSSPAQFGQIAANSLRSWRKRCIRSCR